MTVPTAAPDTIPNVDDIRTEIVRLDLAFLQAETLAHQVEVMVRSANDAYEACAVARNLGYMLAGARLGIECPAPPDGWIARWHQLIRQALGIEWRELPDIHPEVFTQSSEVLTAGVCRGCGCTDLDCSSCIERTGEPCFWIESDLCSACAAVAS